MALHFLGACAQRDVTDCCGGGRTVNRRFRCRVLASIPLSLISTVWAGLQRVYIVGFFLALGSVLSLGGVAVAVGTDQGVPVLMAATSLGPIVALLMSGALLLGTRADLRPSHKLIDRRVGRELVAIGVGYLLLQTAIAVATSSDSLVLAHVIGPAAVTEYSVVARLSQRALAVGGFRRGGALAGILRSSEPGGRRLGGRSDAQSCTGNDRAYRAAGCGTGFPWPGAGPPDFAGQGRARA